MTFNLKTPPVWATQAARELDREWPNLKTDKEVALTIATYAPDAEALADAVEALTICFGKMFDNIPQEDDYPEDKLARQVIMTSHSILREYRARFPKAQETR